MHRLHKLEYISPSYSPSFTLPRKNLLGAFCQPGKESRFDRGEVDGEYDKIRAVSLSFEGDGRIRVFINRHITYIILKISS
jgi:hypothetical protein